MVSYEDRFNYDFIPKFHMECMLSYVNDGIPMGGFLTALFANDLSRTFSRSDEENFEIIPVYVSFIHNEVPSTCHGSYEIVKEWIRSKHDLSKEAIT